MKSKFSKLVDSETPVLIDFYATWCGPCQTLSPVLEKVKKDFGDQLTLLKIDVDKNQALAAKFQVRSVPTMVLFKKGELVWRQSGLVSKRDISAEISKYTD